MLRKFHGFAALLLLLLAPLPASAWDPQLKADSCLLGPNWAGEIIGTPRFHMVSARETLMELARDNMLGYTNLKDANPDIDPWMPQAGQTILLPYATILPVDAKPGITINLAELRLYYIWENAGRYHARTYPLGIGSQGTETPTGQFSVLSRIENPTWTIPPSVRAERPNLPESIPPGPNNPLGHFWLGFSTAGLGIHGTNIPLGVGRRVSHGCLRLYAQDIEDLFNRVEVGTPVQILDLPVKVGRSGSLLFLEVHRNLQEDERELKKDIVRQARALDWSGLLDWDAVDRALRENRGIPFPISLPEQKNP